MSHGGNGSYEPCVVPHDGIFVYEEKACGLLGETKFIGWVGL